MGGSNVARSSPAWSQSSVATSKMADELVDDMLYAARANDMEELQTAIDAGAPIDCRDPNDTTPLMMAAANGHLDIMTKLLESAADVNAVNGSKNSALHWAAL